jgi:hypothetical protein
VTLHGLLAALILAGRDGMAESEVRRFGVGVGSALQHLMQLRLVVFAETPSDGGEPRYWASNLLGLNNTRGWRADANLRRTRVHRERLRRAA